MGALLGLVLGVGLLLVWQSLSGADDRPHSPGRTARRTSLRDTLAQAGVESLSPASLVVSSLGTGVVVLAATLVVSGSVMISGAFAVLAAYAPLAFVRFRAARRRDELRELWPDVVDHLASAVRAGLSLPEALGQVRV